MINRKINFALCILIVLVIIGQFAMMFQPYLNYTPKLTRYQKEMEGKVEKPENFNLFEFVWTDYYKIQKEYLVDELDKADQLKVTDVHGKPVSRPSTEQKLDAAGEMSNGFVMGIVGMNVLGLTVLIMTIFTRKSLVQYLFNLAWTGCSLYMAFGENFVLQKLAIDSAAKSVYPTLKILAIASIVLVLLRGYPWFYSRYIYKKPIDLEALNA